MGKSAKTQPLKQAALTTKSLLGAQKVANAKPAKLKAAGLKATGEKAAKAMPAPPAPAVEVPIMPPLALGASAAVLDRLWAVVMSRRDADPAVSHSARLLSRGTAKIAQKFGEEAVECLIGSDRTQRVSSSSSTTIALPSVLASNAPALIAS